MSNNKQNSVEWLFEQVCNLDWKNIQREKKLEILRQAKAKHKEESITYAHDFARQMLQNKLFVTPEIIYNETFNNND